MTGKGEERGRRGKRGRGMEGRTSDNGRREGTRNREQEWERKREGISRPKIISKSRCTW